jgi:phosphoesterase RecJ-like protein
VIELTKYTKELSKLFSASDNILLICHINPDGDAIGSQLALYHFLTSKGKKVKMLSPNYLQEFLKWMNGVDQINIFIQDRNKGKKLISEADLIVMLDFNQSNRLGEAENAVLSSDAGTVVIDHHLNPDNFASLLISDPTCCSTSELVFKLVTAINKKPFSSICYSEAIYVGIITDTGNFEHGSYSGDTMRIVADIIDAGISKEAILDKVYNNFSAQRMRLMGFMLNERMTILEEFSSAYIWLTRDDLARFDHVKGDTEGFVNMPLSIKGIVFSALFVEKDGFIKASFRSKGSFPVNRFASEFFSGGGHMNASGGERSDNLQNTIAYFTLVLKENFSRFNEGI